MVWPYLKVFWLRKDDSAKKGEKKKKRWEDNIKEWTRMDFANSTRAAVDRTGWKGGKGLL